MNKKCILIHMDKGSDITTTLNNFQCLYTIYYLQQFENIDIVVHSVNGIADFLKQFQFPNLNVIDALDINFPNKWPYLTRLYSLIHPVVNKYDECIMYDNDLQINIFDKVKKLFDMPVKQGTLGWEYIGQDGFPCLWFGFVKINMNIISGKISEEMITQLELEYKEKKWHNTEENLWVRCLDKIGLQYEVFSEKPYCHNKWKIDSRAFIHYGSDSYHSNKIENCLRILGDGDFMNFIFRQGEEGKTMFFKMVDQISKTIISNYRDLIGKTKEDK